MRRQLVVELSAATARGPGAGGGPGSEDGGAGDAEGGRCVLVESNYRVYAYTASLVQHAVLGAATVNVGVERYSAPQLLMSVSSGTRRRNC